MYDDRIQPDETSVVYIGEVEASIDVSRQGRGYAAVGRAKLGLLIARREGELDPWSVRTVWIL